MHEKFNSRITPELVDSQAVTVVGEQFACNSDGLRVYELELELKEIQEFLWSQLWSSNFEVVGTQVTPGVLCHNL